MKSPNMHTYAREDYECILFVFVSLRVVCKDLNASNWSAFVDNAQGSLGSSGSILHLWKAQENRIPILSSPGS